MSPTFKDPRHCLPCFSADIGDTLPALLIQDQQHSAKVLTCSAGPSRVVASFQLFQLTIRCKKKRRTPQKSVLRIRIAGQTGITHAIPSHTLSKCTRCSRQEQVQPMHLSHCLRWAVSPRPSIRARSSLQISWSSSTVVTMKPKRSSECST